MILNYINNQIDLFAENVNIHKDPHPFTAQNIKELRPSFKETWKRLFDSWLYSCSRKAVNLLLNAGFSAEMEQSCIKKLEDQFRAIQQERIDCFLYQVNKKIRNLSIILLFIIGGYITLFFKINATIWKLSTTFWVVGICALFYARILHYSRKHYLIDCFILFMRNFFKEATQRWDNHVNTEINNYKLKGYDDG